jgi:hypothetical protein
MRREITGSYVTSDVTSTRPSGSTMRLPSRGFALAMKYAKSCAQIVSSTVAFRPPPAQVTVEIRA